MKHQRSLILGAAAAAYAVSFDPQSLFGPHVSEDTLIASAADSDFSSVVSPRWSSWEAPEFVAAIKPVTEGDIQEIVRIAAAHNISFLATNNGHGTGLGYGTVQNALNINLGRFNSIVVDAENNRMTVGGGVKFGDIFEPLYKAGKEIPTGNAQCVSAVGATVGGGIGVMTGLHGLTLDSLRSVRIVTASGDLVTASETKNADLFWAIRGAGANFGIITSATYEIYNQTNQGNVVFGSFTFPAAANVSVWETLKSFDGDALPPPLALTLSISYNHTTNQSTISTNVIYFGTEAAAQPYLDRFQALNHTTSSVRVITTPALYSALSTGVCASGARINTYTIGLKKTDVPTFQHVFASMVDFYETHPGYRGVLLTQRYSSAKAQQVPESATAHPWRDVETYMLLYNIYADASMDSDVYAHSRTVRSDLQATSGFADPHVYLNYDFGDEGVAATYGSSKLPKLRRLKAQWDRHNLFGAGNPLY
ncbi:hypothetical protein ANO14919_060830 [Xylariales sp. No.14919]|nr:hypothetical protein ANO14919_060830 [Xylariales sp. No.14919]